jgi:hypothetical protein
MLTVSALPSNAAAILADPEATAVTKPDADTTATLGLLEVHVGARPEIAAPEASVMSMDSWSVLPRWMVALRGWMARLATTGTVTLIAAFPVIPSLVAVMIAAPAADAVTSPFASTDATLELLLDQMIARPSSAWPAAS